MADDTSTSGGLMAGLGGLLKSVDPMFLMSMGAGLMSGARFGSNAGEGLLQGLNMYQQQKQGQLQQQLMRQQVQQGQMGLDWQRALMGARMQALNGNQSTPGGGPTPAATPSQQFLPGISPMPGGTGQSIPSWLPPQQPSGSTPTQNTGAPNGYWEIPTPQSVNEATFPGELMPRNLARVSAIGDPKVQDELEKSHYLAAQRTYGAQMNTLRFIAQNQNPGAILTNSPALQAKFSEWAQAAGVDPKNASPADLRNIATYAYNQYAGSVGGEPLAVQTQWRTEEGPLGSQYQTNPISGERKQVKAEEPLKDVIDPSTGLPTNVRASAAEGKQPFVPSIFGAANVTDQSLQFMADTYRTTGKFPANVGRNLLLQGKILDKVAADAAASGDTAGSIAARSAALKANGQALDQNTKLEAATTSYYNTLDKNLTKLQELQGKVDTSGIPLVNKVYRAWQQNVSGSPDVAAYVTYLNSAASEFAKIQSGSLGNAPVSDAARKHADEIINKFMSAGQIGAVVDAMRGEGNNRLSSIRDEGQAIRGALGTAAPSANQGAAPQSPQTPAPAAPPGKQAPVRVNSPQEALALKPGTVFMTPDGRLKVR